MSAFWICFAAIGIIAVPCVLMFLICGTDLPHKITGAIVVIVFWFLFSGAMYLEDKHDMETWNNGICVKCEGEYLFSSATKYRSSERYFYTCEDCGHTIELYSLME